MTPREGIPYLRCLEPRCLWLLDKCDLEGCATTAAELGQWDFHLAVAPVRFAGTSGSPVNAIATF